MILSLVIPATALIFAAVFAGLWWQDRSRMHVAAYAYCYCALAAGVIINILILGSVGPLGIVSYHLISASGLIALAWATAHRIGTKAPLITYWASVLVTCSLLWICAAAGEFDALRTAQNVNSSLIVALIAQNLWQSGSRRLADRAVIWVLGALAVFGFVRPLMTTFSANIFGQGDEGAAMLLSLHVLILCILLTLQAIALIATIVVDRSDADRNAAAHDPLSGLPMRAMFESEALALQEKARMRGVPLSLIIADLDHFKIINDTYGHAAGDAVIAEFGRLIANEIRPHDICGRIGGEEFCVLAYQCDGANARSLADRIRAAADKMAVGWGTQEIRMTASLGIAQWQPFESYSEVFGRADKALYEAKAAGRDATVLASAGNYESGRADGAVDDALIDAEIVASNPSEAEAWSDWDTATAERRAAGGAA